MKTVITKKYTNMNTIHTTKQCKECLKDFPIYEEDINFYKNISPKINWEIFQLPSPSICPNCRAQRRLAWKNELSLYKNNCNGCGSDIVSRFHRENPHKNYCHKCWASDAWDARDYGLEIDFSIPVFSHIQKLIEQTPFQNLIGSLSNIENNATYTNCTADIKDSYMVSESDFVDKCLYGRLLRGSSSLVDCLDCSNSENCYECTHSKNLYNCQFTNNSENCQDSSYLKKCIWCQDCLWCSWLINQKYHILNIWYSREEYFEKKKLIEDNINDGKFLAEKETLFSASHKDEDTISWSENAHGSYINNSKNVFESTLILWCEDIRYSSEINDAQDIMDVSSYGSKSYKMYESMWVGRYSHDIYFCSTVWKWENLFYCIDTKKSRDCFGCVNMKFARYCIFNKQYTQKEYGNLVPKLIQHMQQTGEWGEFFPMSLSPFNYSESLAWELYTLNENNSTNTTMYSQAALLADKIIPAQKLPLDISEVPDDILSWAIKCEVSGKPFRIIKQELLFYRKFNISLPHLHPDERRKQRNNIT